MAQLHELFRGNRPLHLVGAIAWLSGTFIALPLGVGDYFLGDDDYQDTATYLLFAIGLRLLGVQLIAQGKRM